MAYPWSGSRRSVARTSISSVPGSRSPLSAAGIQRLSMHRLHERASPVKENTTVLLLQVLQRFAERVGILVQFFNAALAQGAEQQVLFDPSTVGVGQLAPGVRL